MTATRALGSALAAATALWFAFWLATPLPEAWRIAGMDIGWIVVALLGGAAAFAASLRPEQRETRTALRFLGAGSVAWGGGQAVWTWYELATGTVPYPSLADIGYIAALPLLALGVLLWPRAQRTWRPGDVADGLLMVGAVTLASYVFVVEPIVGNGIHTTTDLLLVAYPIADALLLGVILVGLTLHSFLQPGRLLVLASGLVALVAADTLFALEGEAYLVGIAPYDAGWTIGFALIGLAALAPARISDRFRLPGSAGPIGVIGLLTAGGVMLEIHEIQAAPPRQAVGTVLMLVLFVALALRYVVVARGGALKAAHLEDARASLEHEYRVLEATIEASRTGMCLYDSDGRAIVRNHAWGRLLGDEADLSGRWAAIAAEAGVRVATADGRSLFLVARSLASGERLVTVDDVTDEEREREARDRLLAEVVGAQDLEARRIAEVLHDDVVQRLTALGMRVELAALRTGEDSLLELAREAGAVTASIRRLLIELHPAVLESQGLGPALDAAAGTLRSIGVAVHVDELDARLSPELEALAYRLVQEAFANVLKHARAERVDVSLSVEDGVLRCAVADDGAGFDPLGAATAAIRRGSLGLHLVRERIELAGGRFDLESTPGGGTRFTFELPVGVPALRDERAAEAVA
jgi:signal transduction histidine kinase